MLRVLSKQESFDLMESQFAKLKPFQVIDLCYKNRRFPAIVYEIYARSFSVVPLNETNIRMMFMKEGYASDWAGKQENRIFLPDSPDKAHPMWNIIGGDGE